MILRMEMELKPIAILRPVNLFRLVIAIGILLLILSGHGGVAEKVIGLYAIGAILFSFDSKWSFIMALILLVAIPFMQLLYQPTLADTYAVDCFYFLVLGVVGSLFELKQSSANNVIARVVFKTSRSTSSKL